MSEILTREEFERILPRPDYPPDRWPIEARLLAHDAALRAALEEARGLLREVHPLMFENDGDDDECRACATRQPATAFHVPDWEGKECVVARIDAFLARGGGA